MKLSRLFKQLEPEKFVCRNSIWAIKVHFGEEGSHNFIRPHFIRVFTDALKALGAKSFLTDSNTLYAGSRTNSVDHLQTAIKHGFVYEVTGAPVIIADGLRGDAGVSVELAGGLLSKAFIASEIISADGIIVLSHFKGHALTGFGGALKNLGMGLAARRGKLEQHSGLSPKLNQKKCTTCKFCFQKCAHEAIFFNAKGKLAIDSSKCVACGSCISFCPNNAIEVRWDKDIIRTMEKMTEYAKASLNAKKGRALFINFLQNISPLCDCVNHSDAAFVPDIAILAGTDPVALDAASVDLVNQAPGLPGSALPPEALRPGSDKLSALHPNSPWRYQLEYAEKIGLGRRSYKLEFLPEA